MVIDRFEGEFAIIETLDGSFIKLPRNLLPKEACEGDVLALTVEKAKSQEKREKLKEKMNKLFKD